MRSSWSGWEAPGWCPASWRAVVPGPWRAHPWGSGWGRGHQLTQAEALPVPGACCHVPTREALHSPARASPDCTVTAGSGPTAPRAHTACDWASLGAAQGRCPWVEVPPGWSASEPSAVSFRSSQAEGYLGKGLCSQPVDLNWIPSVYRV